MVAYFDFYLLLAASVVEIPPHIYWRQVIYAFAMYDMVAFNLFSKTVICRDGTVCTHPSYTASSNVLMSFYSTETQLIEQVDDGSIRDTDEIDSVVRTHLEVRLLTTTL